MNGCFLFTEIEFSKRGDADLAVPSFIIVLDGPNIIVFFLLSLLKTGILDCILRVVGMESLEVLPTPDESWLLDSPSQLVVIIEPEPNYSSLGVVELVS